MIDLEQLRGMMFPQQQAAPQQAAPMGGGGLLEDPQFNMGVGLLAASAPGPRPTSFGNVLGRASEFAGKRQDQALMNDVRRTAMQEKQTEKQNLAAYQEAIKSGMDPMQAAQTYFPQDVMKAQLSAALDPNAALEAEVLGLKRDQMKDAMAQDDFTMAENKQAVGRVSRQLDTGLSAISYLKTVPGAETLFLNPDVAAAARKGDSGLFTKAVTNWAAENLAGVPDGELTKVLSAAELVHKAIKNIAGSQQRAVAGQRMAAEGLGGGGAGLDVVEQVFSEEKEGITGMIGTMGWDDLAKGSKRTYPFQQKEPTVTPMSPRRRKKPDAAQPPADTNVPVAQGQRPTLDYMPSKSEAAELMKQGITQFVYGGTVYGVR